MPYLELSLPCTDVSQPRLEAALEDLGALAVTLTDAHADAPDEQAIFEPGVGEQPLWGEMRLTALFPEGSDGDLLLAALESFDAGLDLGGAAFRVVEDQDWERAWLDQFHPLSFGRRTHIVPWNQDLPEAARDADAAVVRLDPGLAFGSGTHPTTALCLEWLDGLDLAGREVLDFGCGSGILAVAALKLGAARADAIDNDPQAILATDDNAARNDVADRLRAWLPEDAPQRDYPVVVANILASALDLLAPQLAARTAPGGRIALSGILAGQEDELLARYAAWFDALEVARREDWIRIAGVRRAANAATG
ncbi:50S ribosomal protein L11 methyltransferase [Coralloluteibacterium thermophilus]|uniref:Ribosomal protein L11 methyltransferase n=1 Tax=Coralloluteibacterium thermophilum TaxID=2707049 RepID=A0ABV9NI45_9GAMM